jgi:hypothetical protein
MSEQTEQNQQQETQQQEAPQEKQQLVPHRCRVGHVMPLMPGALKVEIVLKDPDDKPIGAVRTNTLCPLCVGIHLDQLFETFPLTPEQLAELQKQQKPEVSGG